MKIERIELVHIRLPLVGAFRTSFGSMPEKDTFLLRVISDGAARVGPAVEAVKGHPLAKAVLETAILDAELRGYAMSLATYLGSVHDRVPSGVSVGIMDSIPELLDAVSNYVAQGYVRIKLKIEPGWDFDPVRAVRREFGDDLLLQVDANTAYSLTDAEQLRRLDEFGLLMLEQPLAEDDLRGHAELAKLVHTPICLDETINSARDAAAAIALGACRVVNVKPARVGGYLEARRIHDVAAANGIPVWCGGMLETGIGRAANLALALLTRQILPSLLAGVWLGAWLLGGSTLTGVGSSLLDTVGVHIVGALADEDHVKIIVFTPMIGGMVGIVRRNGGTDGIVKLVTR